MTFSIAVAAAAFVLIFPVEFPDKTFVATLVLATRFRPLLVWIGVASAFLVQTIVAVVAGQLLTSPPRRRVEVASSCSSWLSRTRQPISATTSMSAAAAAG